jgi:hypothetical protein
MLAMRAIRDWVLEDSGVSLLVIWRQRLPAYVPIHIPGIRTEAGSSWGSYRHRKPRRPRLANRVEGRRDGKTYIGYRG